MKPDKSNLAKIASLNKVFLVCSLGSSGLYLLHSLIDSHPEIITIPVSLRPISIFLENKNSSKEMLIEKIFEGDMHLIFNKQNSVRQGDFSNFEISRKIFKEVLEDEISMVDLTHRNLLNAIHYAYVKATDQDISKVKTIVVHLHELNDTQEFKLTLNDYPDSKWLIPIRHPLDSVHSDAQFYNQCYDYKSRTLPLYLHKHFDILKPIRWENLKLIGDRAIYIKFEDLHANDLHGIMQSLSVDLGISFCKTMLNSTLGGAPYISTSANNSNIHGQSSQMVSRKYKKTFSYQDIRFIETTFRQYMKRFNFKFESDANMSRDELLSVPILKKPNIFTQMLIKPRVDYQALAVYKNKHSLVRALDKMGLARIFLTLAALIVKGYSPTAYTETRSQNELAAMRVKVIDENIKFNSIGWDSEPSENIKQELSG